MLGLMFLAGVGLLIFGLVPRVIDKNPFCTACRFDLAGLLAGKTTVQGLKCPECGGFLYKPGAVRIGNRRRRPRFIWAGAVLAILGIGPDAFRTVAAIAGIDLIRYKPLWLLERGADSAIPSQAWDNQKEIVRRLAKGDFTPEQARYVAAKALALQSDLRVGYDVWGEVYGVAHAKGFTTQAQDAQFVSGSMRFRLAARERIAVGDPVAFDIVADWRGVSSNVAGLPSSSDLFQSIHLQFLDLSLGGLPLAAPPIDRVTHLAAGRDAHWGNHWPLEEPPALPASPDNVGRQKLVARVRVQYDSGSFAQPIAAQVAAVGAPTTWDTTLTADVEVLPRGSETVKLSDAAGLRERLLERIQLYLRFNEDAGIQQRGGAIRDLGAAFAFDCYLNLGDSWKPIGVCTVSRDRGDVWGPPRFWLDDATRLKLEQSGLSELRVILKPSVDVAKRTVDMTEIYAGEDIVLTVPLR